AVVKNDRCAHAVAAIAIDRGHVRTADAIVIEMLVEGLDAHPPHAFSDEIANRIIDHGSRDPGAQAKAVGEISRHVKLAAANMNLALSRFAKWHDAGIESMNHGAEGQEIEIAGAGDFETVCHCIFRDRGRRTFSASASHSTVFSSSVLRLGTHASGMPSAVID